MAHMIFEAPPASGPEVTPGMPPLVAPGLFKGKNRDPLKALREVGMI